MLNKEHLIEIIVEEKNKYSSYIQLCAHYKIEPDKVASLKCQIKVETIEHILKLM